MYTRLAELKNLTVAARDGEIGRCQDFLFDDEHWTVRYIDVNTGRWLFGRRVLISPASVQMPDLANNRLPVDLSREQIESAPGLDDHQTVSRRHEAELARYYGQIPYWNGVGLWGLGAYPSDIMQQQWKTPDGAPAADTEEDDSEHLRSASEVTGYKIHAVDGELGAVEDFVVMMDDWSIAFAVLDTARWLPGRTVLLPTGWVTDIRWTDRAFSVGVSRAAIETAPELKEPISAEDVAAYLRHFG